MCQVSHVLPIPTWPYDPVLVHHIYLVPGYIPVVDTSTQAVSPHVSTSLLEVDVLPKVGKGKIPHFTGRTESMAVRTEALKFSISSWE